MTGSEVVRYLKERSDAYSRDAFVLRTDPDLSDGDRVMAVAYQTISDELREAARQVTG